MGSEFGLYCPPDKRVFVFGRNLAARGEEPFTPPHHKWVPEIMEFPAFLREALLTEFDDRAIGFAPGQFDAAREWLIATVAQLRRSRLDIGFDFGAINALAEDLATRSRRLKDHDLIERLGEEHQLTLPLGNRKSTPASIAARCYEPRAWRKSAERSYTRQAEEGLRKAGFIERGKMLYCSDLAVAWYKGKMRAQEAYLKSRTVTDGAVQLELWDVAQKSLSNKSNRRTELMTRMSGFESTAKRRNHVATFYTLTCPSAFHSRRAFTGALGRRGGAHNQSFAGFTVREAQAWLCKMWARARTALSKRGVMVYGFRIAEPHHDGTPHWHLVLFCSPDHCESLSGVLREKWLSEYANEPGADEHRFKALRIDANKGSATGYISKYIAKNIDGFETGEQTSDEDQKTTLQNASLRVTAWASTHGIRQFQQIGGPAITVYRELRRQRTPVDLPTLEPARAACDVHEFGRFVEFNGGIEVGRHGRIRPWKETPITEVVDEATGEITQRPKQNPYGEPRAPQVIGVMSVSEALETRAKQWRIIRKCGTSLSPSAWPVHFSPPGSASASSGLPSMIDSPLGPVSITVPGQNSAPSLSEPRGWTNPNETSTYGPH